MCYTYFNVTMNYIIIVEVLKAEDDLAHVKPGILLSKHAILVEVELQITS